MNLQSSRLEPIFENQIAVTSGNGSSFNTSQFAKDWRTGGAECFPKKNPVPSCVDYASTTNRSLWCLAHRPQDSAPNCRSLLRDGGQTLNWVGDNGSPTPHSTYSAELSIDCDSLSITNLPSKTPLDTKKPNCPARQLGRRVLMLPLATGQLSDLPKSPQTAENIEDFINVYCKIQVTLTPEFSRLYA